VRRPSESASDGASFAFNPSALFHLRASDRVRPESRPGGVFYHHHVPRLVLNGDRLRTGLAGSSPVAPRRIRVDEGSAYKAVEPAAVRHAVTRDGVAWQEGGRSSHARACGLAEWEPRTGQYGAGGLCPPSARVGACNRRRGRRCGTGSL